MAVVGPRGCGKIQIVADLLVNHRRLFRPNFDCITYIFQHWQPVYDDIASKLKHNEINFLNGVDWKKLAVMSNLKRNLLVFDDVFDELANSLEFLNLVGSGRHKNQHVIFLKHNLYQKSPNSKTIDLNLTHLLLLKSPRDINQIDCLGRQLGDRDLLLSAYRSATEEPYGHLLIDLDPRCDENLRLVSNICATGNLPSLFHINSKISDHIELNESFTKSKYFTDSYNC